MNRKKIVGLINSINKNLDIDNKISTNLLSSKLKKLAEIHPYDQTVIGVFKVVNSMVEKQPTISKDELKKLYNTFYTFNNKLAAYLQEELGEINPTALPKIASKTFVEEVDTKNTNQVLSSTFKIALDKINPTGLEDYSNSAIKCVATNLDIWNIKAAHLKVVAKDNKFIVVKADYNTPRGITSILIPTEIKEANVLEPEFFVGNDGVKELNNSNIKEYLSKNAGSKLKSEFNSLLSVLNNSIKKEEINPVQVALAKLKMNQGEKNAFVAPLILGQKIPAIITKDVDLPKSELFGKYAEKIETATGYANFKFSNKMVNSGRDIVARSILSLGFKNPQVGIADASDKAIIYAVSLNDGRLAFNVPLKIDGNKFLNPAFLVCNGKLMNLSKKSIQSLILDEIVDYKAAAVASPSYELKNAELIDIVRKAMLEENYSKAEDALNVLLNKDVDAYKTAFSIYMNSLTMKKVAENKTVCSHMIDTPYSQQKICAHTNLPINKVFQDKFGNCQPLYRRDMPEQTESAIFTNKVLG